MNNAGALIAVIGLLLFLGGLASPATETHTSTSCIDSSYDPADGCVKTTYQTPNYARGALILSGLTLGIGGSVFALKADSTPSTSTPSSSETRSQRQDSHSTGQSSMLYERIREQRETEEASDSKDRRD